MYELFPLMAGVVIALVVRLLSTLRARVGVVILSSVAFGLAASIISGEIFESLVFVGIDTALVLVAVVATTLVVNLGRRLVASFR